MADIFSYLYSTLPSHNGFLSGNFTPTVKKSENDELHQGSQGSSGGW